MRITFVLPDAGIAGGVRVVATYAEYLQRRGHQVYVVCCPQRPFTWRQQFKSLLKGQGWLSDEPHQHFEQCSFHFNMIDHCRPIRAADVPDADVVVATWWETAEWVSLFPASKGVKVYFIQHDETLFAQQPVARVEATWRLPMHKITVAQWLVDLAATKYGDTVVSLVPNSVDTKQFFAPPRGKQPALTLGLMYSEADWKGCDTSLKAVETAAHRIPDLRLIAFGSKQPSTKLPLPAFADYTYRPLQSQLKDLYARCDAWLFGSRVEGFGLPILEAMACRTPVIGTPTGAAPSLLQQGAGILVKPEDSGDMALAIERLHAMSESEWRTMSHLAYTRATSYTWSDATDLFEAALHQAIERSQTRTLIQDCV